MSRSYQIAGETLVYVKFGAHISPSVSNIVASGSARSNLCQFALASEYITVTPRFIHEDVKTDDFGPNIPAELMWMMGDVTIDIPAIHYDSTVLDICMAESMGGAYLTGGLFPVAAGLMQGAGNLIGNGVPLLASGNHFISLSLVQANVLLPLRFPSAILTGPAVRTPLGTQKSIAQTTWRAIPYAAPQLTITGGVAPGEVISSGAVLFDHGVDT